MVEINEGDYDIRHKYIWRVDMRDREREREREEVDPYNRMIDDCYRSISTVQNLRI